MGLNVTHLGHLPEVVVWVSTATNDMPELGANPVRNPTLVGACGCWVTRERAPSPSIGIVAR